MRMVSLLPLVLLAACATHRVPTVAPPLVATPDGLDAWVRWVGSLPEAEREPAVDAWLENATTTPLVDDRRAAFFWSGDAKEVRLVGDRSGWKPERSQKLSRVPGTTLWWTSIELPKEARLDYKLLVDGAWILDPRCLRRVEGGYGANSEVRMPGYVPPPELSEQPPDLFIWEGYTADIVIDSKALGEKRTIWVYAPGGRPSPEGLGTVYFHDGGDYRKFADATRILDLLIARRDIPPVAAVFVPPGDREAELGMDGKAYERFLVDEVVPHVRESLRVASDPAKTAIVGPSLGGLAAARIALDHPEIFGLVAGQSGVYDPLLDDVRTGPKRAIRFHLVVGTYDGLLESQRRFAAALRGRGYDVETVERPEGHSWGLWRASLGDALRRLYGPSPGDPYER